MTKKRAAAEELDLHGMAVDEAIPRVEEFVYAAFMARLPRVWVIHGKGTGALRAAVRRYLSGHRLVNSCRPADDAHGGMGATEVNLGN